MNQELVIQEINTLEDSRSNSLALVTNDGNMSRLMTLAKLMAGSKVTVPKHLQGSEGDCMAIIIQATNWGMNPFAVAQKTHLVNGTLGYEAQLVNAVVCASGAIHGGFEYEYQGEGAVVKCRVGAVIRGKSDITWGEWLGADTVTTKNSPLWKTNPKQQLGYLQVKNWSRLYAPGAIMGVYTPDELETIPTEKEINPNGSKANSEPPLEQFYPSDQFDTNLPKWAKLILDGKKTAAQIIATVQSKNPLTDAQKGKIESIKKAEDPAPDNVITFAQVADMIAKSTDMDTLDLAADMIGEVSDPVQRGELSEMVQARKGEFA